MTTCPPPVTALPERVDDAVADVEQAAARNADLVLKLTALADRYEHGDVPPERVALLRETADRARRVLADLAQADHVGG